MEAKKIAAIGYFPYIDTFCRSDEGLNFLTPSPNKKGWIYHDQGGSRKKDDYGYVRCGISGNRIDVDQAVQYEGVWYARVNMVRCRYSGAEIPLSHAYQVSPPGEESFYISRRYIN